VDGSFLVDFGLYVFRFTFYVRLMHIVFYASAHGMGHVVRLAEVARALQSLEPDGRITFGGRVLPRILEARMDGPFDARPGEIDAGIAEIDLAMQDLGGTIRRGRVLLETWDGLLAREVEFLRTSQASGVVCDLPGIPLEAASSIGIPGIAMGNFSWDWVYGAYHETLGEPVFGELSGRFAQAYGAATCLARIPVGPPMEAFSDVVQVGLVGRVGHGPTALEIRQKYRLPSPCAFIAIGKTTDRAMLCRAVEQTPGYHFFGFTDLGGDWDRYTRIDEADQKSFPELLQIADVVITTLGHSIFSECCINDTPIVTTPRLDYPEYAVLLSDGKRVHAIEEIDLESFRRGEWGDAIQAARSMKPPEQRPGIQGASEIAELVTSKTENGKRETKGT
jgi:hypothetical protein